MWKSPKFVFWFSICFLSNPLRIIIIKTRKTAIFDIYHQSWISIFALSIYIYLAVLLCLENLICWKNKDRKSEACGQKLCSLSLHSLVGYVQPILLFYSEKSWCSDYSQYFSCQKLNKQIFLNMLENWSIILPRPLKLLKTWYNFSTKKELSHKLCSITFLV